MKRFIIKILYFSLLPLLLFLTVESLIRFTPNAFIQKAQFLERNKDVKTLILGSSHTQQAINPEYLTMKSANLAYNGQDLSINEELFHRYLEELDKLKFLIVEMDYHTLEFRQPSDYFRNPWYYQYHDLDRGNLRPLTKFSMYASSPKFFNNFIIEKFDPETPPVVINDWGFETNRFSGDFKAAASDEFAIMDMMVDKPKRHQVISIKNLEDSKNRLGRIINACESKNIQVLMISTPMYKTFERHKIEIKEIHRKEVIDSLLSTSKNLHYLDAEYHAGFKFSDFRDEDHLNPNGARKFTKIIEGAIQKLKD